MTGFDPKEIEEIITTYRDDDPGEDIPVPKPPADPVTRLGDIYELGPHRLVCGDSRDGRAWELLMGQDRADCMWTDPPYGVDLDIRASGKHGRFIARDHVRDRRRRRRHPRRRDQGRADVVAEVP